MLINLTGIAVGWGLSALFYRKSKRSVEIALLSGLANTAFKGIPLCAVLLGPEGTLYAAIFDAGVDFTIWTVGVLMLQKNKRITFHTLKAMINVPTVAIVIGLVVAYLGIRRPVIIVELTNHLSALAVPLAMFYIGAIIMNLQRSTVSESSPKIWLPITVAVMIKLIQLEKLVVQTVLIQSMMPTITLASILFAKYSADEDMGALTTVVSIFAAILTIPFIICLINIFYSF